MPRTVVLAAVLVMVASCATVDKSPTQSNVHLRPGPAQSNELFDAIAARDQQLFAAVFDTCDADALKPLVAEDFEFYHDKDGLNETSGAHFIEDIRQHCERVRKGVDFRARREVVKGTLEVYPLNNYGAVETGVHNFYAIEAGKPDRMTESAKFLQIWKKVDGQWQVTRVVSYDHRLTQ